MFKHLLILNLHLTDEKSWFQANCPLVGPWPIGEVPSVGDFLRDRTPYLRKFGENHGKLRMLTSVTG